MGGVSGGAARGLVLAAAPLIRVCFFSKKKKKKKNVRLWWFLAHNDGVNVYILVLVLYVLWGSVFQFQLPVKLTTLALFYGRD